MWTTRLTMLVQGHFCCSMAAKCRCHRMSPFRAHATIRRMHAQISTSVSNDLRPAGMPLVLQQAPAEDAAALTAAAQHKWGSWPFWKHNYHLMQCCEPDKAPLRVAMLLSGGVDSSLAMALLKAAGHEVTAFYLQIWFQEDFRNYWAACPWEEDVQYCQQVCDALGVQLHVVPLTDQYWNRVVAHSIAEIRAGRTPNPDMLCNSRVKFGAFYEYLDTLEASFDRVASGHYARVQRVHRQTGGRPWQGGNGVGQQTAQLVMTPDRVKDQTYFLANLSQRQLGRTMFPLGAFTKADVRELAAAADLPNKTRKDSQGICFLGKVKFSEFVREHLGEMPGPIIKFETGETLGQHKGFWYHTVGQRKGVPLHGGPWYVVKKDIVNNIVYVSNEYHDEGKRRDTFRCGPFNWLDGFMPAQWADHMASHEGQGAMPGLSVKVRHGPEAQPVASFKWVGDAAAIDPPSAPLEQQQSGGHNGTHSSNMVQADVDNHAAGNSAALTVLASASGQDRLAVTQAHQQQQQQQQADDMVAEVVLTRDDQGLAAGQYAVFYLGDRCVGSAVIQ